MSTLTIGDGGVDGGSAYRSDTGDRPHQGHALAMPIGTVQLTAHAVDCNTGTNAQNLGENEQRSPASAVVRLSGCFAFSACHQNQTAESEREQRQSGWEQYYTDTRVS